MNDDERALLAVLDQSADQQVPAAARVAAERDIAAIRRGLGLLVTSSMPAARAADRDHPVPLAGAGRAEPAATVKRYRPRGRRLGWAIATAGAGLAVAAATASVIVLGPGTPDPGVRDAPVIAGRPTTPTPPATSSVTVPPAGVAADRDKQALAPELTLSERAAQADQIVVGTIAQVDRAVLPRDGGLDYLLATIRVSETIKGAGGDTVALAWDQTGRSDPDETHDRPWRVGDRVLLFLMSDRGTVFADVRPAHLYVPGERDRYLFDGDQLAGAGFSLDDVRRVVR